jgi:hypothetical protein
MFVRGLPATRIDQSGSIRGPLVAGGEAVGAPLATEAPQAVPGAIGGPAATDGDAAARAAVAVGRAVVVGGRGELLADGVGGGLPHAVIRRHATSAAATERRTESLFIPAERRPDLTLLHLPPTSRRLDTDRILRG